VDLSLAFLAGVFGSMHCVGMCGAIVLAYSTADGTIRPSVFSDLPSHLVYNGGRVLSYTAIGALAGLLGGVVDPVRVAGTWFSLTAGIVMVLSALLMLGIVPRMNLWEGSGQTWLRRLHLQAVVSLLSLRTLESKLYVGLLTPFLPCGLLYSMFLQAAATRTPFGGALTMAVFGAGIVPALILTGLVSAYAGIRLRHYATRLAAFTILVMGLTMIMRGAGVPFPFMGGHEVHVHPGAEMHHSM